MMLPRWLLYHPEVGEGAKFLYCVLHDLVADREGPTRPVTRAKLAELCRVSANTIDRRLAELIGAGAVDKEPQILAGGQVANVYQVWLTSPQQRCDRILMGSPGHSAYPRLGTRSRPRRHLWIAGLHGWGGPVRTHPHGW